MKFSVVALVAVLFVGSSSAWQWGRCRTTTQLDYLDVERFQGFWYEGGRTTNVAVQEGSRCREIQYWNYEEGMIYYKAVEIFDGEDGGNMTEAIEGVVSFDEDTPMKWVARPARWLPATVYWVHDTDYENYAFFYTCMNRFLFFREEMIWIMTREPYVEPETDLYQYISDRFYMTELDDTNLIPTEQARCPGRSGGDDDEGDDDKEDMGTERPRGDDMGGRE